MSFTSVTLTGSFQSGAGEPLAGTLTFTLTQAMANSNVVVSPGPVEITLDDNGSFSIELLANDDPATVPQGVLYGVTEQVSGAQPRDYAILLSHATSPVDISTLMPGQTGWL